MSGKGKKRLQKRAAATYRKSGQKAIDDLKPWVVLSPRPLALMHAQALITSTYQQTPPLEDIEIQVRPTWFDGGENAIVVNVGELRAQTDVSNISDPFVADKIVVEKRTAVGLSVASAFYNGLHAYDLIKGIPYAP